MPTPSLKGLLKLLRPQWHGNEPVSSFDELDRIEAQLRTHLPADFKGFYQWFSNGGEGQLPRGYLRIYPVEELLGLQEAYGVASIRPSLFMFAGNGSDGFALDTSRNRAGVTYPVVEFGLGCRDPGEVEDRGDDFREFLAWMLRVAP